MQEVMRLALCDGAKSASGPMRQIRRRWKRRGVVRIEGVDKDEKEERTDPCGLIPIRKTIQIMYRIKPHV
jgi:hypothetical protein